MDIIISNISDIDRAATQFVQAMGERTLFAFDGKMGAGKTTFIRAICQALGVQDTVTSPTFAIVNEYRTTSGSPLYHFDFYRLRRSSEAYDIGCEEYFYSGYPCFMEWAELVQDILPPETVHVTIQEQADGSRLVCLPQPSL